MKRIKCRSYVKQRSNFKLRTISWMETYSLIPLVILSCAAEARFWLLAFPAVSPSFFCCFNENNLIIFKCLFRNKTHAKQKDDFFEWTERINWRRQAGMFSGKFAFEYNRKIWFSLSPAPPTMEYIFLTLNTRTFHMMLKRRCYSNTNFSFLFNFDNRAGAISYFQGTKRL